MTHHYTTKNPQSEARRQYVHGPLSRHEYGGRPEGEPSFLAGIAWTALAVGGSVAGIAALDMIVKGFAA